MTNGKAIAMLAILDEKMKQEWRTSKEHIKQSKTVEAPVKEYHLRVADYHMGVAHGLEITKELIIQNMDD